MAAVDRQRKQLADRLYEQYGKPLEAQHWGEYVAISPDGRTLLGPTILEVLEKATAAFGPGTFVFKVGEKAVGKWR
ncbi:MAG: hypothetical protein HY690_06435 [Chloroflexi bacterium]|nr:hypothetical protein [Chloroflexota bacterium]